MIDVNTHGEGSPVVLLHGVPVPPSTLEPVRDRLAESYRVVVPDMAGIGMPPPEALEVLEETLLDKGIVEAPVVGHSFGAYRAFQLALSDAVDVERIAAVGALAGHPDEVLADYDQLIDAFEAGAIDLPEVLADQWFSDDYLAANPDAVEQLAGWFDEIGRDAVISGGRVEGRAPDIHDELGDIDIPVYLQTGAEDAATPVTWAREIADELPNAELQVVDGAGHFTFVEAPEETVAPIERFLDG